MRTTWKGLKQLFEDFASWTSTHGIPHIFLSKSIWVKLFWFIVTITSASGFFYQLIFQLLHTYFNYPVNIEYGERVFPAVTFCSINPWKISNVSGTPLEDLIDAYLSNATNTKYGFITPINILRPQRAAKWTQLMYEKLKELDEMTNNGLSYSYDELFIKCSYNTKKCEQSDFKEFYDPFYGRCYTFNHDGRYKSSRASPNYGLRTIFRINQLELLPWTTSMGVSVYIHNQDQSPFMESNGYFVPIGKSSSLGVRSLAREKLSQPYSTCTFKGTEQKSYYGEKYEMESCLRSCIQDKIIAKCGCYDPSYAKPSSGNAVSCYNMLDPNKAIDCIWSITNTDGTSRFDVNKECSCPQSCSEKLYAVTMSNAYWPAEKYKPNECIIDAYAPANSTQRSKFAEWNKPCGKGGSDQGCGGSATTFSTNLPINTMPLTQSTRAPILTTPPTPSLTKPPTSTGKPIIPPIIGILGSLLYGVEQTTQPIGLVTENPLENMTESVQQTQPTSLMTENAPYTQSTEVVTNIPPTKEAPKNLKPCIQWYAKNTLMVEIYYERIDLMTNMELPAYTLLMLISDIGGQIGFWLGMSVISIIECFVFVVFLIVYLITPTKVQPIDLNFKPHKKHSLEELNVNNLYKKEADLPLPPTISDSRSF